MTENLNEQTIIFFDGVCHLCNGFVDFMIVRDRKRILKFAPLQGQTAQKLLSENDRSRIETIVFYHQKKTYYRSAAVLKSLALLGNGYQFCAFFLIFPDFIRDFIYNLIARNRYRIFGQREFCRLPQPEERHYLLD